MLSLMLAVSRFRSSRAAPVVLAYKSSVTPSITSVTVLLLRETAKPLTLKLALVAVCRGVANWTPGTAVPLPSSLVRLNAWLAPVSPVTTTL